MIAMMTRGELVEWMGDAANERMNNVKVVIDCPSLAEAQAVADALEQILGGTFDAVDVGTHWWRWIFLRSDATDWEGRDQHLDAYSSRSAWSSISKNFDSEVRLISCDEALTFILDGKMPALTIIDDLL